MVWGATVYTPSQHTVALREVGKGFLAKLGVVRKRGCGQLAWGQAGGQEAWQAWLSHASWEVSGILEPDSSHSLVLGSKISIVPQLPSFLLAFICE